MILPILVHDFRKTKNIMNQFGASKSKIGRRSPHPLYSIDAPHPLTPTLYRPQHPFDNIFR